MLINVVFCSQMVSGALCNLDNVHQFGRNEKTCPPAGSVLPELPYGLKNPHSLGTLSVYSFYICFGKGILLDSDWLNFQSYWLYLSRRFILFTRRCQEQMYLFADQLSLFCLLNKIKKMSSLRGQSGGGDDVKTP